MLGLRLAAFFQREKRLPVTRLSGNFGLENLCHRAIGPFVRGRLRLGLPYADQIPLRRVFTGTAHYPRRLRMPPPTAERCDERQHCDGDKQHNAHHGNTRSLINLVSPALIEIDRTTSCPPLLPVRLTALVRTS